MPFIAYTVDLPDAVNNNPDDVPQHLAFPFERTASGKLNTVAQGSTEHVFSQAQVVARYPKGYRVDHPDFGITWPEFRTMPVDGARLASEIAAQVPGAELSADEALDFVAAIDTVTLGVGS